MKLIKGMAPPIAARNADGAKRNIQAKCKALQDWLDSKPSIGPEGIIDEVPRTKRQFNLWKCAAGSLKTGIPAVDLIPNSNETLNKTELKNFLSALLEEIEKYETQAVKASKPTRVAELERQLALSERLREISEREVKASLVTNEMLQGELRRLKAEYDATVEKTQSTVAALEKDIQQERQKSSALTKTLANSKSLRII